MPEHLSVTLLCQVLLKRELREELGRPESPDAKAVRRIYSDELSKVPAMRTGMRRACAAHRWKALAEAVILSTGTSIPAQWTCRRRWPM